jgi:hypothetical protein
MSLSMPDVAYYRAQAKLYRELARHLSCVEDAGKAFLAADQCEKRAQLLEEKSTAAAGKPSERAAKK